MDFANVIDYCAEWNAQHKEEDGDAKQEAKATNEKKARKATQADWDALLG